MERPPLISFPEYKTRQKRVIFFSMSFQNLKKLPLLGMGGILPFPKKASFILQSAPVSNCAFGIIFHKGTTLLFFPPVNPKYIIEFLEGTI